MTDKPGAPPPKPPLPGVAPVVLPVAKPVMPVFGPVPAAAPVAPQFVTQPAAPNPPAPDAGMTPDLVALFPGTKNEAAPALAATILPAPSAAPIPPIFGPGPVPAARPVAPDFVATPKKAAPELPPFQAPAEAAPATPAFADPAPPVFGAAVGGATAEPPVFARAAAPAPPSFDKALTISKRIATYVGTTWATFVSSIVVPAAGGFGLAVVVFGVLAGSIAGPDLITAATTLSIEPILDGPAWQMLAIGAAFGALVVSVWSLKDYLFSGRRYLLGRLTKNIPKDEATLQQTPAKYIRFYHGVLQWCGAFAFLCEVVFQLVAFAIITWGVATGFPGFGLFNNPDQLSVANAFLFWVEDAFAIVDGPETLGLTLSTLEPNKAIWAFGLILIFFKIGVVGLILQMVRTSFTLRPGDISLAWQRAYERQD